MEPLLPLEFHGNQIEFFGRVLPKLTASTFFPDHYDAQTGSFRAPLAPVAPVRYETKSHFIQKFRNFMLFTDLGLYSSNGQRLEGYDVSCEQGRSTVYLRHGLEVIGSYEERVLYVTERYRGQGFSTILILAKMAVLGTRPNPDRGVTLQGGKALQSAYKWLLTHNLVESG